MTYSKPESTSTSSSPQYSHLRGPLSPLSQTKPNLKITHKKRNNITERNKQKYTIASLLIFLLPLLLFLIHTLKTSSSSEPKPEPQSEPQREPVTTMDSLISLVNRIQRACTLLGDHGADYASQSLWESLPSVAVVGGQVRFFFKFDSTILLLAISSSSHFVIFADRFLK